MKLPRPTECPPHSIFRPFAYRFNAPLHSRRSKMQGRSISPGTGRLLYADPHGGEFISMVWPRSKPEMDASDVLRSASGQSPTGKPPRLDIAGGYRGLRTPSCSTRPKRHTRSSHRCRNQGKEACRLSPTAGIASPDNNGASPTSACDSLAFDSLYLIDFVSFVRDVGSSGC
jgi:hypothetical protein